MATPNTATTASKSNTVNGKTAHPEHLGPISKVKLSTLHLGLNPRKVDPKSDDYLQLKASMARHGQEEPIHLAAFMKDSKTPVVSGNHRATVAVDLGWEYIDARIDSSVTNEVEYLEAATRANLLRRNLTAGEQLATVLALDKAYGKGAKSNAARIGGEIGRSEKHCQNMLRIGEKLSDAVREAFEHEKVIGGNLVVSFDRAAALASLEKPQQDAWLDSMRAYLEGAPQVNAAGETVPVPPTKPEIKGSAKPLTTKDVEYLIKRINEAPEDGVFVMVGNQSITVSEREKEIVLAALGYVAKGTTPSGKDRLIVSTLDAEPDLDATEEEEEAPKAKGKGAKSNGGAKTKGKKSAK